MTEEDTYFRHYPRPLRNEAEAEALEAQTRNHNEDDMEDYDGTDAP